ncbi:MAG: undecaprenyl/decaprenyl-phosphate alpha-N-acetylglucosaminyl 1-phosphate transferase [Phycisphaeraceae bacterium]|nr:undecaprenyl/decaprenyl-phosphate alpha-N-acetylglucosaminyl 1-phosphate transferase [Phycisphaerales bacterium]MCB9860493.1 undecaprenyl/decaprenyl-phosphate alpha-N-acetylglucosaminyl 1-phosphate transferase [Phycisphaeraceae bacterium]
MILLCLGLVVLAFAVSLPSVIVARRIGLKAGALDAAGVEGQVKAPSRKIPNTGGISIFLGIAFPMVFGLVVALLWNTTSDADTQGAVSDAISVHAAGMRQQIPMATALLLGLVSLHVLGLIDDRKPLGPKIKLFAMGVAALVLIWPPMGMYDSTRLLTLLDARAGGMWLSILITLVWFLVVTNAMNFMDNMDGLSGGVAAIASSCFLVAAILNGQWFIAMTLALMVGACLGFLVLNFPPAKIFMGDGGSLVLGFLLAFLTSRTTYIAPIEDGVTSASPWYAVLMPIVVLAVPLYDFVSVCIIRLRQGRSPFVGDLQHFSHRLVRRGLSRRGAVLVIYCLTLCTGISGILLTRANSTSAILIGMQVVVMLAILAIFESRARHTLDETDPLHPNYSKPA